MDAVISEKSTSVKLSREYGSSRFGQRHVLLLLAFTGMLLMYATRIALSISMVAMTIPIVQNLSEISNASLQDVCPYPDHAREISELSYSNPHWNRSFSSSVTAPPPSTSNVRRFDWNSETQGILHGGFLYGSLCSQIPGGWIAHKLGAKRPLAISMLGTATLTLLSPLAADVSVWLFFIIRVLVGVFQGIIWPTVGALWGQWAPPLEKGRLLSVTYSGAHIGTVFGMYIAGLLAQKYNWEAIFYCFGSLCLVWVLLWTLFSHDTPQSHPRISKQEREYILSAIHPDIDPSGKQLLISHTKERPKVPWKDFFTSFPVLVMLMVEFCNQGSLYTLVFYLPTYLNNIHHFSLKSNGLLSALPYLVCWVVTLTAGRAADFLLTRKYCSVTVLRKLMSVGAFTICGSCLTGVAFSGCNSMLAITFFIIGIGFNGCALVGHVVAYSDMSPTYSSILMGMGNATGVISGIIATYVVGALTNAEAGQSIASWQTVFLVSAGALGLASLLFGVFGTAKRQPWDQPSL